MDPFSLMPNALKLRNTHVKYTPGSNFIPVTIILKQMQFNLFMKMMKYPDNKNWITIHTAIKDAELTAKIIWFEQ
jgi:hypothetical protein